MKHFGFPLIVAIALAAGCKSGSVESAAQPGQPAAQAAATDPAPADTAASQGSDAATETSDSSANPNAYTDGEDAASRDRRLKARASLGFH